jgi:hypothetical protein
MAEVVDEQHEKTPEEVDIATSGMDFYFMLKAELLQEQNTEQARFHDNVMLLQHCAAMIHDELLEQDIPEEDEGKALWDAYRTMLKALEEESQFGDDWAHDLPPVPVAVIVEHEYQKLNAKIRKALVTAERLMYHLGLLKKMDLKMQMEMLIQERILEPEDSDAEHETS